MSDTIENSILKGAQEALSFAREESFSEDYKVHIPEEIDVRSIRKNLRLTQKEFAFKFGLKLDAVRNWEQKRRRPEGPARVLLTLIDRIPSDVQKALS